MNKNLCKKVISEGGRLIPLIIPSTESKGLGIMNPSIFIDNDKILMNLRNVNYTLYHCEGEQLFNNRWGPLAYLNPENDLHLKTTNFLCELNEDYTIKNHYKIDTSKHDIPAVWEFHGLEDARLVRWDGRLFHCGVRRDVKPNGEGRMELSELIIEDNNVKEINRYRINPPNNPDSYCEKNWVPILDMHYHFVKWTNPTEVVKVNINDCTSQTIFLGDNTIQGFPDLRGGSQVISIGNYRIGIMHNVNLFKNKLQQKDATYMHHIVIWNSNWNIKSITDAFSFMDGEIEFCCGLALRNKELLITFGFQDNAAYLLRMPIKFFESFAKLNINE